MTFENKKWLVKRITNEVQGGECYNYLLLESEIKKYGFSESDVAEMEAAYKRVCKDLIGKNCEKFPEVYRDFYEKHKNWPWVLEDEKHSYVQNFWDSIIENYNVVCYCDDNGFVFYIAVTDEAVDGMLGDTTYRKLCSLVPKGCDVQWTKHCTKKVAMDYKRRNW